MTTPHPVLESAVRAAATHTIELLPELDFLRTAAELTLEVGTPVTGVRLDLRTGHPLDLHSLRLAGVPLVPADATVDVNQWRHDRSVDALTLLGAQPDATPMLLTPSAEHCWAEVVWSDAVTPEALVLRQASIADTHRASGLVVSVRDADSGGWRVLHDGAGRVEAARDQVMAHAASDQVLAGVEHGVALVQAMFGLAVGEYVQTRAAVARLGGAGHLPDEHLAAFRAVVNPMFLAQRQREWTVHGPTRTFRFWSRAEKVPYVQQAVQLCEDLQGLTPRVCFGFGAALAVVRDQDLIPHDDDLDLVIAFGSDVAPTLPQALTLLETYLRDADYQVTGDFFAHRKVGRRGQKKIDVFVGIFEEPGRWRRARRRDRAEISWHPGPRGALRVGEVFPVSHRDMLGVAVPLPRDPEHYLRTQYGEDWRVPNPQFRHNWGRGRFKDLAAPATRPEDTQEKPS